MIADSRELTGLDYRVRLAVYRHLIEGDGVPSADTLSADFGLPMEVVRDSLLRLQVAHALVLAPGTSNVWMAHPFSAVPTAHRVEVAGRTYWANCAWDALAIPALLHAKASISSSCPDCAEALRIEVHDGEPDPVEAVVHFLVPPRRFWDNIGFT